MNARTLLRHLTAVATASSAERADARLDRLVRWALRAPQNTDAMFAAVQTLRDLETIDRAEATYVLARIFDSQLWDELADREPDPELSRALQEEVDLELIQAAMTDQDRAREAAYFRSHGEGELADMVVNDPEAFTTLCAEGQIALIDDKPSSEHAPDPVTYTATAHVLSERVLALSATETLKEWVPAWHALTKVLRDVDPRAAVAAIQGLRAVGALSFDESLVLIDMVASTLVDDAMRADREFARLERAIDVFSIEHDIDDGDGAADESRPLEWRVLHHRRSRRIDGLTAGVLRRFGEHRMANLLMNEPDEYARIRDEINVGRIS